MLEFRNTSLYRECNNIINAPAKPVHYTYFAKIHVGKLNYMPIKILSIDINEDYENKYSAEIIVKIAIMGGMYAVDIYPFKDQLEITITKCPIGEVSNNANTNLPVQTERYAATLLDTGSALVEGNSKHTPSKENLNLTVINEVEFQLVNKALQQFRLVNVGGIYRNTLAIDVIRTILTNESKNIKVDGAKLPIGVDIADGYNTNVREHVIIPHGTKLVDVPEYIHVKAGGVYPAGFGYYMQDDFWYVYPCYDLVRSFSNSKILTFINVPPHMFPSIERTYRQNGSNVVILATGDVKHKDNSESQQLNLGNGARFADATTFMNGFSTTENNKTTVSRGTNNTEALATSRADGIAHAPISNNAINANSFLEYSKLAKRNGGVLTLVWENSQPTLITPGAMCKVMYLENDKINTIVGIVLAKHSYVQLKEKGTISGRYVTRTAVHIFCQIVRTGA